LIELIIGQINQRGKIMAMDKAIIDILTKAAMKDKTQNKEDIQISQFEDLVDQMVIEGRMQEAIKYKWQLHIYLSEKKKVDQMYDRKTEEFKSILREER
jgi:hypothetical protein